MTVPSQLKYLALTLFFLAACAPRGVATPVTGETPGASQPPASPDAPTKAVLDAQQWLAVRLSVALDQVQLIEAAPAEWTDSCLGLGQPNESCLQAITPGWRAVFEVSGQRYEIRTDETGSVIRAAASPAFPTGLENTYWSLVSFGAAGTEQPLVEGSSITLMLAGGQAGGSGGCNSYGGTYELDGNRITFGELVRTERACLDPAITEQEQRYFEALDSAGEFKVEGDQLQIAYDGGNLIFEPAVPVLETPGS